MSHRQYSLRSRVLMFAALALGLSGAAMADDSSMSRFGGESYAYFNNQPVVRGNAVEVTAWRQSHPNGLTERELEALSSSDLSGFVAQLNPPVLASVPADPAWHQSHPTGLTERELQALSASSLASWQGPDRSRAVANVAESPSKETFSARAMKFLNFRGGTQAGAYQ